MNGVAELDGTECLSRHAWCGERTGIVDGHGKDDHCVDAAQPQSRGEASRELRQPPGALPAFL